MQKSKPVLPDPEEPVACTAPLLAGDQRQDILIAVNGEVVRIRRGETVQIRRKFAEALENAERQSLCARRAMDRARKQTDTALAAM